MKKILTIVFVIMLITLKQYSYADTTLNYGPSGSTSECPSEAGTIDGYGNTRTKYGVPATNGAGSTGNSSLTCQTHYYYTSADAVIAYSYKDFTNSPGTPNSNGVTNCPAGQRVVGWTGGANGTITCRTYDDTPPTAVNIIGTTPAANSNLLATNSQNFSLNISTSGGAPITLVRTFFEDYTTPNTFKTTSTVCTSGCNENISNVDLNRESPGGFRYYTLRVAQVCDEAGNCVGSNSVNSNLKEFNYNVYANTTLMTGGASYQGVYSQNISNSSNVADGSAKTVLVRLRDIYGNAIVPASGIGRTIDVNFNTSNTLYLNQYDRTGSSSLLVTSGNGSDFSSKFPIGNYIVGLTGQSSTDGDYTYSFKAYTPTSNHSPTYGPVSDPNAGFRINSITFDANGSIGDVQGALLANSNITATFNPLYYTTIGGDTKTQGFIEGASQNTNILLSKNSGVTTSNNALKIEFGSGDTNGISTRLNLKYGATSPDNYVGEGHGNSTTINSSLALGTYNLITKILSSPGTVLNDIQKSYFSTHISYTLDGYDVSYNSDVLGKNAYWGTMGNSNVTQSAIKILGLIYSGDDNYNEIISGHDGNQVKRIVGNITKSSLKSDMRINAYKFIKNVNTPSYALVNPQIGNLNNFADTTFNNGVSINGNVLYYGGLPNGKKVVSLGNGGSLSASGKKTIIVEGGDLYIKSNIVYTNTGSDILGIIVLKDESGNGGNLYIDPSVTQIHANIYTDKSVMSYNGTELNGNTNFSILKNQLYIFGSIFSENTIGGSRITPPKCPFYLTGTCDLDTAQKYDLNYLRRYYLLDSNNDGVLNSLDTPAGGGIQAKSGNFAQFPVIIEYNPKVQTTPPPIFTN